MTQILEKENRLNTLWGQCSYMIYIIANGEIERSFSGGTVVEEKRVLQTGDSIVALHANGTHEYREYSPSMLLSNLTHIVKYVTKPAGIIGGKEVAVESKRETIITLEKQRDRAVTEEKRKGYQDQIEAQTAGIALLKNGDAENAGLYTLMREAVTLAMEIADRGKVYETSMERQNQIEAEFAVAMGDM